MSLDRRKRSRPKRVKGRDPVVAVDLFAGAGGFSAAAKAIGVEVRLAIELNNHACDTYRHNLVESNGCGPTLLEGDITEMSSRHLFLEHFRHGQGCGMLLGGPPCQGFSVHRIKGAGVDDPRNELIHTYFEFVKAFRPKIFLMENVPGMLWPRHKEYIDNFYKTGRRAKYHLMEPVILDARDYGVPQRRKRVFILGVRNDLDLRGLVWPPAPSHGDDQQRKQNPNLKKWIAARDVFRGAPRDDENNRHMNHSDELVDAFKSTPANGGRVVVSDNGPGVDEDDVNSLFTLFFTKKRRGGRGVGLFLCRANLTAGGHKIEYAQEENMRLLPGANFILDFRGAEYE